MNFFHPQLRHANTTCLLAIALAAGLSGIPLLTAEEPASIPLSEIGARATAGYHGDLNAIVATAEGARLRAGFQKLTGEVTQSGLWLESTEVGGGGRMRLLSTALGRTADGLRMGLAREGRVSTEAGAAGFVRDGLIEEYAVSIDGVRQDFLVAQRPPGEGELVVELSLDGATAEAIPGGAQLRLAESGRELAYTRLQVIDATGRRLEARMEVKESKLLEVCVDDRAAIYPVRIDPTFSDANWVSMRGLPGASSVIEAVVADGGGNVYVGGSFSLIGVTPASRIAKWDGSSWSALGTGMNDTVLALAVSGTDLYAGGVFTAAGGTEAKYIAKWDGNAWSALGTGMSGTVLALAVSGTDLYAGGGFYTAGDTEANSIAKWDGNAWSALGSGINGFVTSLAVTGTDLYAGGEFDAAGGTAANHIAKWDGTTWSAMGSGMDGQVEALAASGTDVYAGGYFTTAGGTEADYIAKWDGTTWSSLGSGMNGYVESLAVSGPDLYAGGGFSDAGGTAAYYVAKWNGTAWSALASGVDSNVRALAVSGTDVFAGGAFTGAGLEQANFIAKWDGSAWSALGSGTNNFAVHAMAVSGANLYVGGDLVGGTGANGIATWDGSTWTALGSGVNGTVESLAVSGTDLYVGGHFTTAGGAEVNRIAKWDGSAWSSLGSGMNDTVLGLAVSGTDLYAAGRFTTAGGTEANYIAKWNGSAWSALGSGMSSWVYSLAVSGADLYAAGDFTTAGGVAAARIAKWDGSAWSPLGSGLNSTVIAPLVVSGTDLYVAGLFTVAGGMAANYIAKWDGNAWSTLGSGLGSFVRALAMSGTDLYVGGAFTTAGGIQANSIAKWDGTNWSALGSGMDSTVYSLAVSGTDLYAGGSFSTAGGKSAIGLARADLAPEPEIVVLGNGVDVSDGDLSPAAVNHTDFGQALAAANRTVTRTFWLGNKGLTDLSLGNVSVTGPHADDFEIISLPAATVAPDRWTTIAIEFTPSAVGLRYATLSFTTNDPDETDYDFAIQGMGANSPPTIAVAPNLSIDENQPFAVGIAVADLETSTDSLSISAASDNQALIPNANISILGQGTYRALNVTPVANKNGIATITISVGDGTDITSAELTVTINPVNDPPVITSLSGLDEAGIVVNPGTTTVMQVVATDPDLPVQNLTFSLVGGADVASFTIEPASGALSFVGVPDPAAPGDADAANDYEVIVQVSDDGLPSALTDSQAITVFVPPGRLDRRPPLVVISTFSPIGGTEGEYHFAGFIKEATGLKSFSASWNGEPLDVPFTLPRRTSLDVPLMWGYSGPAENGPNVLVVEAVDLNGRVGRATRTVTFVDPALAVLEGTYEALLAPSATPGLDAFGLVTLRVTSRGAFSGSVLVGGTRQRVSGFLARDGSARFWPTLGPKVEFTGGRAAARRSLGFFSLSVAESAGLSGGLTDAGGTPLAAFEGKRTPFGRTNRVPPELLNVAVPASGTLLRGSYNLVFASREIDGSNSPAGDGFGGLILGRTGSAEVTGYLADGTKFTGAGRLQADLSMALFLSLYRNKGALGGQLAFDPNAVDSDVAGADWLWLRPEQPLAKVYQAGWPEGVRIDALGTKYRPPASLDFGQGDASPVLGNASLVFNQGLLAAPSTFAVSIDPLTGKVVRVPAGTANYSLGLNRTSGWFNGRFLHPDGTQPRFRGILLNKGSNRGGFGFFVNGEGGSVLIDPAGP